MDANRLTNRLASFLLARPAWSIATLCVIVLVTLATLPFLRIEAGMDIFVARDSDVREVLEEVNAHFVNDDVLFVAYQAKDVFSHDALETIRQLGIRLEEAQVEGRDGERVYAIESVTSLATVKTLEGSEDTFRTKRLVEDPTPMAPEALAEARALAKANPIIEESLVGGGGKVGAMVLRLPNNAGPEVEARIVGKTRELVSEVASAHPDMRFEVFGEAAVNTDMAAYQVDDLGRFIPLVYLVLIVLIYFLFRRALGLGLAIATVVISMGGAMAILTLIGSSVNNCSVMLPPVVAALAVADVIHLLTEYGKISREPGVRNPAQRTLGDLLVPVFMTSATTAIGFGSLAVSSIPAVLEFGIAAGGAMMLALVVAVAMVSLGWRRWPAAKLVAGNGAALSGGLDRLLQALTALLLRRKREILAVSSVVVVVSAVGIGRLVVDQNDINFFEEEAPIRRAVRFMEEHLAGGTLLVVSIRTEEENRFLEPRELAKLEQLERFLRNDIGVDTVTSVSSYLKLMHREFQHSDPRQYRVPDTAEQASQLLLLNGDTTVSEFIDEQNAWVRVVARQKLHSARDLNDVLARTDAFLAREFPPEAGYVATTTGNSRLWASLVNTLVDSQIYSISVSIVLIVGLMFVMFRSFSTGLYCVPPNVFPIVFTLGFMGWAGIRLDASTVMIATVALGIAVDDTIHFMEFYRRRLSDHGEIERAIRETMRTKGPAMVGTSLVISLGFLIVLASHFEPTRNFGILISLSLVAAIVGDLILLPALLLVTRTRLGTKVRRTIPKAEPEIRLDKAA